MSYTRFKGVSVTSSGYAVGAKGSEQEVITNAGVVLGNQYDWSSTTATTIELDPEVANVFTLTTSTNVTMTAASAPEGQLVNLLVTASGTSSRTITFSTNFKTTGTLATGTVDAKVFSLMFVGDGTNLNEVARTTAM